MSMLTELEIKAIVERIVAGYAPTIAVGVFGSHALGLATEVSDLDIFVVKQTRAAHSQRVAEVRQLLFGAMRAIDVHVFTPEELADDLREEYSFGWMVARQARVLHGADAWTALVGGAASSRAL